MDEQYGSDAVLLDRVTDAAGVLSEPELDRLNEALVEYERQFPQLFATVYCGALPQQSSLRQFGFWLLNRAAVCDVDATRPNEHGTALVLDIHGRAAFLLHGYLVECYLSDADNAWILKKGQRAWNQGRWADGILAVLEAMSDRLRKRAAEAAKNPAKFNPDRTPEEPQPPRFRRIRQGHRRAENGRAEQKK